MTWPHKAAFDAWQRGEGRGGAAASYDAEITQKDGEAQLIEPEPLARATSAPPGRRRKPGKQRQLSLFD